MKTGRKPKPIIDRLLSYTLVPTIKGKKDYNSCWIWNGLKNNAGYGMMKVNTQYNMRTVHRIMMVENNQLCKYTDKVEVLHSCGNKLCVNPTHLILGDLEKRVELQRKYNHWNPYFTRKDKMYITCEVCDKTSYLPHFNRQHANCKK